MDLVFVSKSFIKYVHYRINNFIYRIVLGQNITRPMIEFARSHFGYEKLIGIEIGVNRGRNALDILQTLNMETFYLIDPYEEYFESGKKIFYSSKSEMKAKNVLSKYNNVIRFIKKTSGKAFSDIIEKVDFIYIDGNHEYLFVMHDIKNYWLKVKANGIMGGHDFNNEYMGVIKAVCEFAVRNGQELHVKNDDWWIVKE